MNKIELSNKMKYIIILVMLMSICANPSFSSTNQDSVKLFLIEYLIEKGELIGKDDISQYLDNVYLVKIDENWEEKSSCTNIFSFGTYSSHSQSYVLLKCDSKNEIIDINHLDSALLRIINYLKERDICSHIIVRYVETILELYQRNSSSIPWTE